MNNYWELSISEELNIAIPRVMERLEQCLSKSNSKYIWAGEELLFRIGHTASYMIFLYILSNQLYKEGFDKTVGYVYYLNKIMHSIDWLYAIEIPVHFGVEHPLSSALGRAKYGAFL